MEDMNITNENYKEILAGELPVVIDFWAPWCGPCKALAPTIEELAAEYEGKAVICKCNVDECDEVVSMFPVRSIPTLVFLKKGEMLDRCVGLQAKATIVEKINAIL